MAAGRLSLVDKQLNTGLSDSEGLHGMASSIIYQVSELLGKQPGLCTRLFHANSSSLTDTWVPGYEDSHAHGKPWLEQFILCIYDCTL
jgi:hypothetical protein